MKIKKNFSKKQSDAVELGVELTRQYLYERENTNGEFNKYASFSKTVAEDGTVMSYSDKNRIVHNMVIDEAYVISGLDRERFSVDQAMTFPHFERAYFSVVEEMINKVDAKTEIEQAFGFADVRSLSEGDSATFHIPSKHLLAVSTVANGVRNSHIQKLHQSDVTLAPTRRMATVGLDLYKIATGTVDYGWLIARVIKSFRTKQERDIINLLFGAFNTMGTPFKLNAYVQDDFVNLVETVEAANSAPAQVFGTKVALSKVLPTSDYLKMGLGQEYINNGYIQAPFGVPTVRLNQSVDPNSGYTLTVPSDKLLVLCSSDKVVKFLTEGQTQIRQSNTFDNADNQSVYSISQAWDMQIASMMNFGFCKVI